MRARIVIAVSLLTALAHACGNERQPMDGTTARDGETFLGPIAADYRNTMSPAEFHDAAARASVGVDQAMTAMGFGTSGVALTGASAAEPDLPDLGQCDQLRDLSGGFLRAGDVVSANGKIDLLSLSGLSCGEIAQALDASFADVAASAAASTRQMGSLGLTRDRCTAAAETPPTTPRAAVGYEFLRLVGGEGLYLTGFALGDFQSTFEGGGDGQTLAMRLEADLQAKADQAGDRQMHQEVTTATLVKTADAVVETHKAEMVELRKLIGEVRTSEMLGRHAVVTLGYGAAPSISEESKFTRLKDGVTVESWTVKTKAVPAADGLVSLDVQVVTADADKHITYTCAP